jgi:hypothetical protein
MAHSCMHRVCARRSRYRAAAPGTGGRLCVPNIFDPMVQRLKGDQVNIILYMAAMHTGLTD